MNKHTAEGLRNYIQEHKCIVDGAFGTYYAQRYHTQELPELANDNAPERVIGIHREYLEAGANVIRTNTFSSNTYALHATLESVKENITRAYSAAQTAIEQTTIEQKSKLTATGEQARTDKQAGADAPDYYILCDIGPMQHNSGSQDEMALISEEYLEIVKHFYGLGGRNFLFETFASLDDIREAVQYLTEKEDTFVMTNFMVNHFGYTSMGMSLRYLMKSAQELGADCVGCNCAIGPVQMRQLLSGVQFPSGALVSCLPNAGYPTRNNGKITFSAYSDEYFADAMGQISELGVDFLGGCCGTTPATIKALAGKIDVVRTTQGKSTEDQEAAKKVIHNHAFWNVETSETAEIDESPAHPRKLIAVELAPPFDTNDTNLMEAAHLLQAVGVDVITFPDSPSGRTRLDPILVADKVLKETGIPVMPHICCRDKNSLALRSQLLGAKINRIHNFLMITGDPVNIQSRDSVKSVFQFDALGLMNVAQNINEELLSEDPIYYGGAINQGRRNLDVEIRRVKKKMEAGATFFLTQPVFSDNSIARLRKVKEETGARILCGIMPFVSYRNASFMKNEIAGVDVPEDILSRYPKNGSRAEGEAVGVAIAKEMMGKTEDFVDGYYFSFPFNRVHMLKSIVD